MFLSNEDRVSAAIFGDSYSGASTDEVYNIKYNGAAWNYSGSRYESTSFTYKRGGRTLLFKTAYNGKVNGYVLDDLRSGSQYTTYFSWSRGQLKYPFTPAKTSSESK